MGTILTGRQRMILGILNSRKGRISGAEIAGYLGITDRTVRTDIRELSAFLKERGVEIDALRGRGYLLKSADPAVLQQIVYENAGLLTQDERVHAILGILLDSRDLTDLGELEDELFISRSTLEGDLRRIAFSYEKERPHIRMIRHRNAVGMEADEWKRRYILNLLYMKDWNFNYEGGMTIRNLPVGAEELKGIEDAVSDVRDEMHLQLTEYDYLSFVFSIAIAVRRIRMNFPLTEKTGDGSRRSVRAVGEILDETEKLTGTAFSETERAALADELRHRLQYNDGQFAGDFWDRYSDSACAKIIVRTLGEADRELGLSLLERKNLKSELLYMLLAQTENPWHTGIRDVNAVRMIRTACMDGMELACRFAGRVEYERGLPLAENEILELAASLSAALHEEAERLLPDGARVQVVSHMSLAGTKVLMAQLKDFFGSRMNLADPMPVNRWMRSKTRACDLAIVTTRIERRPDDVPVMAMQGLLTREHMEEAGFLLTLVKYRTLYPGYARYVTDMIGSFRLYYQEEPMTRWEILERLASLSDEAETAGMEDGNGRKRESAVEASDAEGAGNRLLEELKIREHLSTTAFREGTAIPHSWRYTGEKDQVTGLLLKEPVDWGGVQTDTVFLLTVGREHHRSFMRIYASLALIARRMKAEHLLEDLRTNQNDPENAGRILRDRIRLLETGGTILT